MKKASKPLPSHPLLPSPSGHKPEVSAPALVERPGQHGPLSGTTGAGPKKPPTPGKGE